MRFAKIRGTLAALLALPLFAVGIVGTQAAPATAGPVIETCVYEVVPSAANVRYGPGLGYGVNYVLNGGDRVNVWGNAETKDADHYTWVNISYSNSTPQWTVTSNLRLVECHEIA